MTPNQWPGPNEKQVIVEMLEKPDSVHWTKCSELMRWLILKETGKFSFSYSADFVDEVLQNAMESVIKALPAFRAASKLTTWLTRIAYTRTIDALRSQTQTKHRNTPLNNLIEGEETEVVAYELDVSGTLEELCTTSEELREVLGEIAAYIDSHASSERNRKIAHMVFYEERTLEVAAREVGVSSAVASYFIRTLRQHLEKKFRSDSPPE